MVVQKYMVIGLLLTIGKVMIYLHVMVYYLIMNRHKWYFSTICIIISCSLLDIPILSAQKSNEDISPVSAEKETGVPRNRAETSPHLRP